MDGQRITNAPALAYVKEWNTWIIVNDKTEMISWTDDPAEIDWLSMWVLKYGANQTKMLVSNPKLTTAQRRGNGKRHMERVSDSARRVPQGSPR